MASWLLEPVGYGVSSDGTPANVYMFTLSVGMVPLRWFFI
jgi:hypothetical protein